jgi:hypothetical protein
MSYSRPLISQRRNSSSSRGRRYRWRGMLQRKSSACSRNRRLDSNTPGHAGTREVARRSHRSLSRRN